MSNTNETREFRGYFRPRKHSPWEWLCEHADYAECWSMLLALAADRRTHGSEMLVSRTVPTDGAPAGRRRRCY